MSNPLSGAFYALAKYVVPYPDRDFSASALRDGSGAPLPPAQWTADWGSASGQEFETFRTGELTGGGRALWVGALLGVAATLAYKHFRP